MTGEQVAIERLRANLTNAEELNWRSAPFGVLEVRALLASHERMRLALEELTGGDGVYYVTQERAMAPGIADRWPAVIPAPHTPNGRLVKRNAREALEGPRDS